jgi:hypothetical protein
MDDGLWVAKDTSSFPEEGDGVWIRPHMNIDRRSKARYPIELAVSYQTLDQGQELTGRGRSLNMSSRGLLVSCRARFALGTLLKATLEWPLLLDGTTPLQLVTVGRVARCDESSFAMTFEQYQFRILPRREGAPAAIGDASAQSPGSARLAL